MVVHFFCFFDIIPLTLCIKNKNMIVFNTTYTMPNEDARNFVIWAHQAYMPKATSTLVLKKGRLLRVLSHKDEETECFSLQFEVESTAILHKWYQETGKELNEELLTLFDKRITSFSTILEVIDGE